MASYWQEVPFSRGRVAISAGVGSMDNSSVDFRAWCKTMNLQMRKGLTKEQQEIFLRTCREKMRKARIMQVRDQENKFSARQVQMFQEKKQMKADAQISKLKEMWEEEHQYRLQQLEERCCFALNNIGEGHKAAALLVYDKVLSSTICLLSLRVQMNNAKLLEKYAEETQALELQRYKQALQEESIRKERVQELQKLANKRKKTKEVAACLERSIVRFATHTLGLKRKRPRFLVPSEDEESPNSPFKPSMYKYTYFHAAPFAKPADQTNRGMEMDAFQAASAHREALQYQKEMQADISKIISRRMVLRGQAASSRVLMDKRVQDLQRELERVERLDRERKRRFLLNRNTSAQAEPVQAIQNVEVRVGGPGGVSVHANTQEAEDCEDPQQGNKEDAAEAKTLEMKVSLSDCGRKKVKIIVPDEAKSSSSSPRKQERRSNSKDPAEISKQQRRTKKKPNKQLEIACERLAVASLRSAQSLRKKPASKHAIRFKL